MKNKRYKWNYKKFIKNINTLLLYTTTILFYSYIILQILIKLCK